MPELTYEPDLTALLIVDPYNDFISEGGKLYDRCAETIKALNTVEHMAEVMAAARAARIRVFFAPHHRWRHGDYATFKYMAPSQTSADRARLFEDGTWGGSFHPAFQPQPGDVVALEHWLSSGFANTDLDLQLKKHGLHKVIVVGLRANTCIESTVRFAAELGYEVTLVKDAIASFSMDEMRATLELNAPSYASAIVTTDDIVAKLEPLTSEVTIMDFPVLADSSTDAVINAPVDSIDLTEWVFTLTDQEYQACSKNHIAAGVTGSSYGKRISVNVENVGRLLVAHYIETVSERRHCQLISQTDAIGPTIEARSKEQVLWEFFVTPIDEKTTKFTNRVQVCPVAGFEEAFKKQGVTLEQVQAQTKKSVVPHNEEETPLFAKDIERKALAGQWSK